MPDREVKVKEVLKDIHAGMEAAALMEKYKLSPTGLQNLYEELAALGLLQSHKPEESATPKARIKVREFLKDFRSGLTDAVLRQKYDLSRAGLDTLFKRLLDLKAINADELFGMPSEARGMAGSSESRKLERYCLDFLCTIYDLDNPELAGTVRDISEKGVGVEGIPSVPGDIMTFVVTPEEFLEVYSFQFRAECRWNRIDENTLSHLAGFRIISISEQDLERLQTLIPLLTFCT
jgi:uncharacterized protein (DUF433 family)